jgi:hypothetical protein
MNGGELASDSVVPVAWSIAVKRGPPFAFYDGPVRLLSRKQHERFDGEATARLVPPGKKRLPTHPKPLPDT